MKKLDSNTIKGMVVALKANYLIVEIKEFSSSIKRFNKIPEKESIRLLCQSRQKLSHSGSFICVGDYVTVEEIDWKYLRGVISHRDSRNSLFKRPLVANVTDIFIIISVAEPTFDFDQASRFLITAEQTNLNIIFVLTKVDLISPEELDLYMKRLDCWGYRILLVSVINGMGINLLIKHLENGRLSVLCGPSGVGKTSLINNLFTNIALPTSSVSKKIKRGKNTTRHVELFSLENGALVADTPGFNRPEIDVQPNDFPFLFPEIRSQLSLNRCKFRNCLHRDEPGCVIDKNFDRYLFYRDHIDQMLNCHHLGQEG